MKKSSDQSQITAARTRLHLAFSAAWGRAIGFALLTLSAVPSYAGAAKPILDADQPQIAKFSRDLRQQKADTDGMVNVIVQYRQTPNSASYQAMGSSLRSRLDGIRAVTLHLSASKLAELANDPNVAYISPDRPVRLASYNQPQNEDYDSAVEGDVAASQFALDGTGIGVALIDSGISDHSDLHNSRGSSRVVYSQSFVRGDSSTADKFGHGTHVAGLIGGNGSSSGYGSGYPQTYSGMAPNVNFINLRVLDQSGVGTDSQVIAAIQQAIALKTKYNIRVINMSLGRPTFESYTLDPVCQAVEAAWKAGIVVVVAAGNDGRNNVMGTDGYGTIGVPANDPTVITVGATRTMHTETRVDDVIASYSSKGPTLVDHLVKPDLVAPGNHQVSLRVAGSTLDQLYPQLDVSSSRGGSKYFQLSGTSMSTPLVSGAAALMLQKNSSLTPDQVKARLMKTAWKNFSQYSQSGDGWGDNYNDEYDIFTYGAGYLDVDAALNNTDVASGMALSPTAVFNSKTGVVTIKNTSATGFGGTSVVWGSTSVVWGNSVVWGANTIVSNSVVWGSASVVWGSTYLSGCSVVWGAKSIAGTGMGTLSYDGDN
jgi:serine protease AprX